MKIRRVQATCCVVPLMLTLGCDYDHLVESNEPKATSLAALTPEVETAGEPEGEQETPVPTDRPVFSPRGAAMPLDEVISRSALICRAKAVRVDPNAYDEERREAFTAVTFSVIEVLFGGDSVNTQEFTLYVRGGVRPDGLIRAFTGVPTFAPDETYLLFLRAGGYHFSPLANRGESLLREVDLGGRQIYVDESGSPVLGLDNEGVRTIGTRIAESTSELLMRRQQPDVKVVRSRIPSASQKDSALRAATERQSILATVRAATAAKGNGVGAMAQLQLKPDPLEFTQVPHVPKP